MPTSLPVAGLRKAREARSAHPYVCGRWQPLRSPPAGPMAAGCGSARCPRSRQQLLSPVAVDDGGAMAAQDLEGANQGRGGVQEDGDDGEE